MKSIWIEVFKAGTHTSGNGITKEYTQDDLDTIARKYNEQKDHEAPLVIGHPATDDPAYGWVKTLQRSEDKLLAFVDQIQDGIEDAVKQGLYKRVSIALYPDNLLRHVGLLGAVPPAVKGLAAVSFASDAEFDEYVWATDEYRMPTVARILSSIRDFFIEKFGLEATNAVIDKDVLSSLQAPAETKMIVVPDPPGSEAESYAETQEKEEDDMKELEEKLGTLEQRIAGMEATFAELKASNDELLGLVRGKEAAEAAQQKATAMNTVRATFAELLDTLIRDGKVLPAEKDGLLEEYGDLLKLEESATYAEGDTKISDKFQQKLLNRTVLVAATPAWATSARAAQKADIKDVPVAFAEMADQVDGVSIEIDKQIRAYAEQHKISYEEAAEAYGRG